MSVARPRCGVSILPMSLANLERCADVVEATWPLLRSRFVAEMRIYFAARAIFSPAAAVAWSKDRRAVGCGVTVESPLASDVREMSWVCVHPDWRGQGIGARIVERLFASCRTTEVAFATRVPKFYRRLGCLSVHRWPDGSYLMLRKGK